MSAPESLCRRVSVLAPLLPWSLGCGAAEVTSGLAESLFSEAPSSAMSAVQQMIAEEAARNESLKAQYRQAQQCKARCAILSGVSRCWW